MNDWIRILTTSSYSGLQLQIEDLDTAMKTLAIDQAMTAEQSLKEKEHADSLELELKRYSKAPAVIKLIQIQTRFINRVINKAFHTWENNSNVIANNSYLTDINNQHQSKINEMNDEINSKVNQMKEADDRHKKELDEMELAFTQHNQEQEEEFNKVKNDLIEKSNDEKRKLEQLIILNCLKQKYDKMYIKYIYSNIINAYKKWLNYKDMKNVHNNTKKQVEESIFNVIYRM